MSDEDDESPPCGDCHGEGRVFCQYCSGSGIGMTGPVEDSRCPVCSGLGEMPCVCVEDDDDDR